MPDWIVKLVDDKGAAITDATVSLARESEISKRFVDVEVITTNSNAGTPLPTMNHGGGGVYRLAAPLKDPAGDWRLIVRSRNQGSARGIVIQPLTIVAATEGGFKTTPRNLDPKGPKAEVATVEIKTTHAAGDSSTTFEVKQHPASEVVLLSGTVYHNSGEPLRTYCEGRRDLLAGDKVPAARRIDDGTLATFFSLDDRAILWFVRARSKTLQWVLVHRWDKPGKPDKPVTPGAAWPSTPNKDSRNIAIHPDDLYDYLEMIGSATEFRARVREVSIYSHAFLDGPILYNTYDKSKDPAVRDPNDFDCRRKDWFGDQFAVHSNLAGAMTSEGRWHLWGCNANPRLVAITAAANLNRSQKKDDTTMFSVVHVNNTYRFEARMSRRRAVRLHLEHLTSTDFRDDRTYASLALGQLRCEVIAALPGTWANFSKATRSMLVDPDPQSWPIIETFHKEEPALAAKFKAGTGLDGVRYVKLRPYASVNWPTVPASSAQYEAYFDNAKGKERFAVEFHGGQMIEDNFVPKIVDDRVADARSFGSAHAGKSGHRYVFRAPDDDESIAVLVLENGSEVQVFRLARSNNGNFDTAGAEVRPPA